MEASSQQAPSPNSAAGGQVSIRAVQLSAVFGGDGRDHGTPGGATVEAEFQFYCALSEVLQSGDDPAEIVRDLLELDGLQTDDGAR